MLIGGWGLGARDAVLAAARRANLETVQHGPLTVAAATGTLHAGAAGTTRIWLSGRLELGDLDVPLRRPDSPVAQLVANAIDCVGGAALARLYGEYLLVAADDSRNMVRVSHDHLGARTLSYARCGEDTYFAEHVVDLLGLLRATPSPDRRSLVQWIDRRTIPPDRSLFSGIARLPPGEALEITERSFVVRRFWRPVFREPAPRSREESAAEIAAAAFAAIKRAAGDLERAAVKLSGGLDSACVAAGLAAATRPDPPFALSGTFTDYPDTDESPLIEQTVRTTGLRLVKVPYSSVPIMPSALAYVQRWMVPPSSPNHPIWEPLMAEARALGVDGLLDGEGGDELFSLAPYLIADRLRRGRLIAAWQLTGRMPGLGPRPDAGLRWRAIRAYGIGGGIPPLMQRLRRGLREPRAGIGPLVKDADVPYLVAQDEAWGWKTGNGPLWWSAAADGLVNGAHRIDASGELARDAVTAGVPRRHPFMHDVRLIECVLAVPPEHQFDPVRDRPLLRDGLRGAIPEQVRMRHAKSYFDELVTGPLTGPAAELLVGKIRSADAPVREYVRAEPLEELAEISSAQGFRRHALAKRLFCLACVDAWLRCLSGVQ